MPSKPPSDAPPTLGRDALLAAAVSVATFGFQLPFFDRWFSPMDEGHVLQFADLLAQGGELYRDATLYPLPGAFYLLSLAFRIFEPSYLLARGVVAVEFSLFAGIVFLWMRRMLPTGWALASVLLIWLYRVWTFGHWQLYSYSTTALLVLALACVVLLSALDTGRKRTLALAGVLFGLGVLCKQDYGAAVLLAVSLTLVVRARTSGGPAFRPAAALFAGFFGPAAVVGALTGLHYWRAGALSDLIHQTVLGHFLGIATFRYPSFPPLLPLFAQDPALRDYSGVFMYFPSIVFTADWDRAATSALFTRTAFYDTSIKLFFYLPFVAVAGGALRLVRRRARLRDPARRSAELAELLLWGVAASFLLLVSLNKPQDTIHLAVLYWPLLCLALVALRSLWRRRRALAVALAVVGAVPAVATALYSADLLLRLRDLHPARIALPRGGIHVRPSEAALLEELVTYVEARTGPGEPVAVLPYFPLVNFLARRPAPDRSAYIVWPVPDYADREQRIIDAMEATRTRVVLYHFNQVPNFPTLPEYAPKLVEYLVDHFEVDRAFSRDPWAYQFVALRRRTGTAEGAPLSGEALARGEIRVEPGSGPRRAVGAGERDAFLARAKWPFREVLALRPTAGGRTVLALEVDVPRSARLRGAVGTNAKAWTNAPPARVRFAVDLLCDGERHVLYARSLAPQADLRDRGFFELDRPLDACAGRRATLELSTSGEGPGGEAPDLAGWSDLRIVAAEAATPAGVADSTP